MNDKEFYKLLEKIEKEKGKDYLDKQIMDILDNKIPFINESCKWFCENIQKYGAEDVFTSFMASLDILNDEKRLSKQDTILFNILDRVFTKGG